MVRSFMLLLILAVVFLSGMILGIDREHKATPTQDEVMTSELTETQNKQVIAVSEMENDLAMDLEKRPHFTQKTAIFLEEGVKGFYEIVVEVLYQITSLFF